MVQSQFSRLRPLVSASIILHLCLQSPSDVIELTLRCSQLTRRVDARKKELELEIREDPLVGETRIVWGCGGEAKVLLFREDFVGISIRKIPNGWSLADVKYVIEQKLSPLAKESIRNFFFLYATNQGKQSARILFDCPKIASAALKVGF